MILLNKFMLGYLDQFEENLSNSGSYISDSRLLKDIHVSRGIPRWNLYYLSKKLYVFRHSATFSNEILQYNNNKKIYWTFKIQYYPFRFMSIIFKKRDICDPLCILTTDPSLYRDIYIRVFLLSDAQSITNTLRAVLC